MRLIRQTLHRLSSLPWRTLSATDLAFLGVLAFAVAAPWTVLIIGVSTGAWAQ